MTQERKVKADIFLAATLLFIFIDVLGWLCVISIIEGSFGSGILVNFLANSIFYFFPLGLLLDLFKISNPVIYLLLLAANILLYSFLISKFTFKFFVKRKRYKPSLATYYVTISLLLIIFANVIGFIILNS